jgi:uncharacterized SAM-binding protein YcdF (DUF218 family)
MGLMLGRIEEDRLAKIIWEYHHLHHELVPADIILCFTSFDLSVPEYVARLYQRGLAPFILISGKHASAGLQTTNWGMTEAEKFAEVMVANGVLPDKIILENESVNSGENVRFSYELLKRMGEIPRKIILAQKPTMERRAYATFRNYWPEEEYELMVTSPPFSYEEYVGSIVDRETMIHIMVGDLQRIKLYPAMGFQIPQEIPDAVWGAYEKLVAAGFDKHLVR